MSAARWRSCCHRGRRQQVTDYFQLFDYDINLLVSLFEKVK